MNKASYQKYLQSPAWYAKRNRRLQKAGHRCEFCTIGVDHKGREVHGERCTATTDLQAHHINYSRIGAEEDSDLQVLCHFHHLVRHITSLECACCSEMVETDDDDAIAMVNEAITAAGGNIKRVSLDELCWHNVCDYCGR